ncbi:MAG: Mur ligase domain-containing protein [Deinococcales bacterium]
MTLYQLIKEALKLDLSQDYPHHPQLREEVKGIAQDSRRLAAGYVFITRRGEVVDGHRYIPQALEKGVLAIVGEASPAEQQVFNLSIPYIQVADDKGALGQLASAFYGRPSEKLVTFGVTGTDGKTTTSYMLYHLLSAKYKTGLMSTASVRVGQQSLENSWAFYQS